MTQRLPYETTLANIISVGSVRPPNVVNILVLQYTVGWLGSQVLIVLDSGAEGPGFKSQSQS